MVYTNEDTYIVLDVQGNGQRNIKIINKKVYIAYLIYS